MSDLRATKISKALLLAGSASMISMGLSVPAFAQAPEYDEVIVTGTYIRKKSQGDQASPVDSYGRDNFSSIGAANPVDLINTLTINAGAQNNADGFNQSNSIGTTNINLRGLGVSSTLVLLNGRRQTRSATATLSGDQFVDMNSLIPTIAIGTVDTLKDGATSLYGSDAVAGVVNFKTRKGYQGVGIEVGTQTTTSDSQTDFDIGVIAGANSDRASFMGAVSYFDRSPLTALERRDDYPLRNALSVFGQPGTYLPLGGPNAFQRQPDPACSGLAATDNSVVGIIPGGPIAGTCQFDFGDFFTLVADEQRIQAYGEFSYEILPSLEFFAEAGLANTEVVAESSPTQPILFPPLITAANPANAVINGAPGAPLLFFGRINGAGSEPHQNTYDSDTKRFVAGLRGEFGSNWSWETAYTRSSNDYLAVRGDTFVDAFLTAISCPNGPNDTSTCYNPLFGATNSPSLVNSLLGDYTADSESSLTTLDAHVTGDLFELPAGPVGVAIGGQYRQDKLTYDYAQAVNDGNFYFNRQANDFTGEQSVYAGFIEAAIPVTSTLDIQAAIRYEDFGDDVNSVDPKIGFLFRPSADLSFRGTYGTSFRAPSIFQLNGVSSIPARVFDPQAGGLATISNTTAGDPANPVGNQSSDTYNLGFTWEAGDSGFTFGADYWRFEYTDFITPENATAIVAAVNADPTGPLAPQVTRSATGSLLAVTSFFRNAGALNTDGIDFNARYDFPEGDLGLFGITLGATTVLSYDLEDPIAGSIDGLGQRNFTNFGNPVQKWRGNLGLGWEKGIHSFNGFVRYIDSYTDENNANAQIDSFTTVDAQYSIDVSEWVGNEDNGTSLTFGVKNAFDQKAPNVISRTGYDALSANPLGRQVYVRLKASIF